jgi:2-dehydro-3-deoxyglucarate aldolase/4-hydroxy-2-oxoheptanedioate aldolase
MRDNPVKAKLAAGGSAFGTMAFEFFTPGYPQAAKAAGAEFALFDMEHSGVGVETVKNQIQLCRGIGLVPMVRVPAGHYHFIARMLDSGAMGIMVPMVETVEQARHIVSCTRYPPHGRRGAAFGVAGHDDYAGGPVREKIAAANARTMVICLIETAKGIENVDAIAAVPGVDVCWLGHFDLTNFLGIPAQFDHPRYLAGVDAILAACRRHRKIPGFMASDRAWAETYQAKGFRMVAYGVDVNLMQAALADGIKALRAGAAKAARAKRRKAKR